MLSLGAVDAMAQQSARRYNIAVCDWMILKRQKIGEFKLAHEIGADGVEMDMGGLGRRDSFDSKLRDVDFQKKFRAEAAKYQLAVPSVAMSGFYAQSFVAKKSYRWLIEDCLNTMEVMGAKIGYLPLGGCGDLNACSAELVKRLHEVGEMAAKRGLVIGIRTQFDAKENKRLLKEIDSDGIKIYYNFQDAVDQGRDVCKDLKRLGRKRICQIHASLTDSVTLDRDPRIDLKKVKATLDKMHWSGWLVVERSRDASQIKNVKGNFGRNVKYLHEVFAE